MKNISVYLARRLLSVHNPTSNWRCYCWTPSSSTPPNNKLFVAGSLCLYIYTYMYLCACFGLLTRHCFFCVEGLSWSVDEKSLKDAFSAFGEVNEVRIMYDKETGRSRGFGFVYFSKEGEANCAKDAMDGKAFLGRPLRISFALEKVRGAPAVVPRLSNIGDATNRYN
ncbi:hypothetical protein F0562_011160 [Nyssa sinensis]|uniref:RRM domain-containing protein n=1 Tax=Nyssa sinensis TaxID=561372 RepID=A0A5J5A5X1_9ASTE|nr:hypothetical protein F0562_011160 [Nyssa sinensis]